jgi:putative spermidine/putrescine transport system permease protein
VNASSRRRRTPAAVTGKAIQCLVIVVILCFILLPMLVVLWTSIQPDAVPSFPPKGLSLRWWREAMTEEWLSPIWFSLEIAAAVAVVAGVLGTAAAYGLSKIPGRSGRVLQGFLASPLLLPEIVLGIALLQAISQLNMRQLIGTPVLICSHVVIGIPFVVRTVSVSLVGMDPSLEKAAADLGASRFQTMRRITLPLISTGAFTGMLFSFLVSFNNVELSLFLSTRTKTTAPLVILNYMQYEYSPTLACVAVLAIAIVTALVAVTVRFTRLSGFVNGLDR